MPDVFSPEVRARVMSRIRSSGNRSTELRLMALLRGAGIRGWRRRWPLLGRPDFAFPRQRVAVFVDGCFWHGCPRCRRPPASNQAYWMEKNRRNTARDRLVNRTLSRDGWAVVRIWEHSLALRPGGVLAKIKRSLDLPLGDGPQERQSARSASMPSLAERM